MYIIVYIYNYIYRDTPNLSFLWGALDEKRIGFWETNHWIFVDTLKNIPNGIWIGQPTKFWSRFSGVFVALDFQKTALHCSSSVARCFLTCSKEHVVHHPSNPGFPRCFHPWHNYIRFSTLKNDHRTCVDNKNAEEKPKLEGRLPKISWYCFISFPFFSMCFHIFPCMLLPLSHDTVFGYPYHPAFLHPTISKKH